MGIASFVVGLVCLILSPFLNVFLILPSILALVLGIIDTVRKSKKKEPKGLAIAGIILSIIALAICILVVVGLGLFIFGSTTEAIESEIVAINEEITNNTANIGESVTVDNVTIKFVSVDKDYKDYYDFVSIDDDYKILKADFEFENKGDYAEYVSYADFNCYADKFTCDRFTSVNDGYFYETIESGKKAKGSIYFEVPVDAETIEIKYDGGSYNSPTVTFVI